MPPKDNSERACEECIHYWACSRQCGEPMAQSSATGCECYETVKSSMAYYVGTLDGAKVKIPNRLRELVEADKDGRLVVLPCKVGDTAYYLNRPVILDFEVIGYMVDERGAWSFMGEHLDKTTGDTYSCCPDTEKVGKTVFLTREEAERAMEGRKDG